MNTGIKCFLTVLGLISIQACGSFGSDNGFFGESLETQVLHNTLLCGAAITAPTTIWIDNPKALQQRYQDFVDEPDSAAARAVDFTHQGVLLIAMGPQPSSGYRLNTLPQQPVRFDGTTLQVALAWQEPDPESGQAAVITSPCLLLVVPNVAFQRVRVIDELGAVRLNRKIVR